MLLSKLTNVKNTISHAAINKDNLTPTVEQARAELFLAYHDFDNAEPSRVDAAIHRLIAAEENYALALAENATKVNDGIFDADINSMKHGIFRKITVGKVLGLHAAQ